MGLAVVLVASLVVAGADRRLPKKFRKSPFHLMSLSVGYPNQGWQLRAKKLKSRPYLKIKSGSRANVYGHPALVLMLYRSAREVARSARGAVMLVGDLSAKGGGPLSGHHSHQSGRDADVAFFAQDKRGRPVKLKRFVAFDGRGRAKDASGYRFDDHRNWLLVLSWVRDKRAGLSHIFVSRPLRKRLLAYGAKRARYKKYMADVARLLKQPPRAAAHDDHFHVRIDCPRHQKELCRVESRR